MITIVHINERGEKRIFCVVIKFRGVALYEEVASSRTSRRRAPPVTETAFKYVLARLTNRLETN